MAGTGFFDGLGDGLERELRAIMTRRRFERGEVVFHEGDPGVALHIVESGWFLIHTSSPSGERVGMTIEGPGGVFGEMAMIAAKGLRTATIRALRAGETMSLDNERFQQLRHETAWVDRFLVSMLVQRVERLTEQLAETAWLPAEKRVCRQLGRLAAIFEPGIIQLRQVEIAYLAQTTRPTVSTVLGDLRRAGILATGRGTVEVLDPAKLEARM